MNTAEYVDGLITELKEPGKDLSTSIWETALACVGWPYVFGAEGAECTPTNRKRRASSAHPTIVSKCQVLNGSGATDCAGCQWFPDWKRVRMFDCQGFTEWVLSQYGIDIKAAGTNSQWNNKKLWVAQGTIDTIPDGVLVCLFQADGDRKIHTGFGFRGETVECQVGVQHFKKRNKKWTHWAIPFGVDGDYKPTLRRGSKGEYVTLFQTQLGSRGYDLGKHGVDGDFGMATEAAVKAFQKDNGLTVDGVCGPKTWAVLDDLLSNPVLVPVMTLYTVHIPRLTEDEANGLIDRYPGSWKTIE